MAVVLAAMESLDQRALGYCARFTNPTDQHGLVRSQQKAFQHKTKVDDTSHGYGRLSLPYRHTDTRARISIIKDCNASFGSLLWMELLLLLLLLLSLRIWHRMLGPSTWYVVSLLYLWRLCTNWTDGRRRTGLRKPTVGSKLLLLVLIMFL